MYGGMFHPSIHTPDFSILIRMLIFSKQPWFVHNLTINITYEDGGKTDA